MGHYQKRTPFPVPPDAETTGSCELTEWRATRDEQRLLHEMDLPSSASEYSFVQLHLTQPSCFVHARIVFSMTSPLVLSFPDVDIDILVWWKWKSEKAAKTGIPKIKSEIKMQKTKRYAHSIWKWNAFASSTGHWRCVHGVKSGWKTLRGSLTLVPSNMVGLLWVDFTKSSIIAAIRFCECWATSSSVCCMEIK